MNNCDINGTYTTCPKNMKYFVDEDENETLEGALFTKNSGRSGMFTCSPYSMYDSRVSGSGCKGDCSIVDLNKEMGIKRALCFEPVTNDNNECYTRTGDGRLKDVRRNMLTTLDVPPYVGDVGAIKNVYSEKLKDYKDGYYKGYADINTGQIQYYVDNGLVGAYPQRSGNWVIKSNEDYMLYKNPMGVVDLHTERQPLTTKRPEYLCGPKDVIDELSHREDIMGKQAYQFNSNSFQARYGNNYK